MDIQRIKKAILKKSDRNAKPKIKPIGSAATRQREKMLEAMAKDGAVTHPGKAGDCDVDLSDFVVFAGDFLTGGYCHDYNCDNDIALPDLVFFSQHFLHSCVR